MNDAEINTLKVTFKGGDLFWHFDRTEAPLRVVKIGEPPAVEEGDVPEPSECAYLEGGTYVALWNAEPEQFVTLNPVDYAQGGKAVKSDSMTDLDPATQGNTMSALMVDQKNALQACGYSIAEDTDQPGLWLWTGPYEKCDASLSTEASAVKEAWSDAAGHIMGALNLSSDEWEALSLGQQIALTKEWAEEIGAKPPAPSNA